VYLTHPAAPAAVASPPRAAAAVAAAAPLQVWVVFIGGAVSLFITTVLAENNGAWFPAIARANKAMAQSKKQAEQVRH